MDAILGAVEARRPVPVFGPTGASEEAAARAKKALALKEEGNKAFLAGNAKASISMRRPLFSACQNLTIHLN